MKKVGFTLLALLLIVPAAMAADSSSTTLGMDVKGTVCALMAQFGGVFNMLRILAFVGAGFTIAGWAWGWIKGGAGPSTDDLQKKGIGLLVGFTVLFGLGAVISALMSMTGENGSFQCVVDMWKVQQ
jgi:hypothetical protein